MNSKPLVSVVKAKGISLKDAAAAVKSFINKHSLEDASPEALAVTNRERLSLVPEEIIEKLTTVHTAIEEEVSGETNSRSPSPFVRQKGVADEMGVNTSSSPRANSGSGRKNLMMSATKAGENGKALHEDLENQAEDESGSSASRSKVSKKERAGDNESENSSIRKEEKKSKKDKKGKKEKKEKKDKKRKSSDGEKTPKSKKAKRE